MITLYVVVTVISLAVRYSLMCLAEEERANAIENLPKQLSGVSTEIGWLLYDGQSYIRETLLGFDGVREVVRMLRQGIWCIQEIITHH